VHGDRTARFNARQQSALASGDFVDVRVADDAEADKVAGRGQFGGLLGDLRCGIGELLEGVGSAGPQRRRMAGLDDPPRHRCTLAAQPDESDPH
jgi:hypothetical protein